MTATAWGTEQPSASSPALDELTRSMGSGIRRVSRWTHQSCDLVPGGQVFFQMDLGDRERYTEAGCTYMGAQPARRSIVVGGEGAGMAPRSNWIDAWCCQPGQVVPVFEQYVASPEYRRRKTMGLVFAGVIILGATYMILNYKKLGGYWGGKRRQEVSWSANPDDDFFDGYEDEG